MNGTRSCWSLRSINVAVFLFFVCLVLVLDGATRGLHLFLPVTFVITCFVASSPDISLITTRELGVISSDPTDYTHLPRYNQTPALPPQMTTKIKSRPCERDMARPFCDKPKKRRRCRRYLDAICDGLSRANPGVAAVPCCYR